MQRYLAVGMVISLIGGSALAETVTVKVDGMVCAFCATGLEQLFTEEPGVEKVHVDLDQSALQLTTQNNVSDDRIHALVEKAGFETAGITRHP